MFKKVQLKFFAIITSILLALFIAVLASINLIMEAVMQRQSKVVLKQIATSIEFDDTTSTFSYTPEPFDEKEPPADPHAPDSDNNNNSSAPTEPTTQDNTQDDTDSTDPPSSEDPTGGSTQPGTSSPDSPTEPSDPPSTTTAPDNNASTQQTTTQTTIPHGEHYTEPPYTTYSTQPATPPTDEPPLPPEGEYPPPPYEGDETYPPFEWDDDYKDNNHKDDDNGDYNYNEYPPTYENYNRYWESLYSEETTEYSDAEDLYDYDENTEQQSYTPESSLTATPLFANENTPLLNGYTIVRTTPRVVMAADNTAPKKDLAPVPKSLGSIEFFVFMADTNGKLVATLNNEAIDADVAQKYISAILSDGASSGMLNSYQFCQMPKDNGTIMVFTDKSAEIDMLDQLTRTTILIGIVTFIILSILAFFFSKKSIEPIKVAFEKQKQFVSDASHELKTPLTIISANADVLSDEIGENKWLAYIKSQTERMNVLVNDLLNLTRLENNTADFICADFNLSKAMENTALPFECQAFEMQKTFEIDIQENLTLNGSERHIKQMAAIFIDNALKYSKPEGGIVRVTLSQQGDKKVLSVYNTGSGIKDSEKDKIFERFYRSDDSRARTTGGYGLGLAIAHSIIEKHKFKVTIDNVEGESICFNIIM